MNKTIRILLADDHPLIRTGIRATLATEENLTLVGEATDGHETQQLSYELKPDVLLLDLNMPGPPPVETVSYLREHCPETKVIVLTAHNDDIYVRTLVASGVAGYILKDEAIEAVVRAIQAVIQGDGWFSWPVMEKLVHQGEDKLSSATEFNLTDRERQILRLIAQGKANSQIAKELHLSEQTVRNYVCRIYAEMGTNSRVEITELLRKHNLVEND